MRPFALVRKTFEISLGDRHRLFLDGSNSRAAGKFLTDGLVNEQRLGQERVLGNGLRDNACSDNHIAITCGQTLP